MGNQLIFSRFLKIAKSDYYLRYICLSVRMEQFYSHWTDFQSISYFDHFSGICWEKSRFIKIWQNERVLHM